MFTPQEVQDKVFPKASGFGNGYQMSSVDEFLDTLTEDYTSLFKENVTLKAKLKVLADKVEEYRATEDSMRATLLTAQKMAAKLVQEAQLEHDSLIASAKEDAAARMAELNAQIKAEEDKLTLAQKTTAQFIARSEELVKAHSAFLSSLPELDMLPDAQADASPVTDDTVTNIGKEILTAFSEMESFTAPAQEEEVPEAPAEVEVNAETDAVVDEPTTVIPSDFKLSLDELKFGRNYGKDDEE